MRKYSLMRFRNYTINAVKTCIIISRINALVSGRAGIYICFKLIDED